VHGKCVIAVENALLLWKRRGGVWAQEGESGGASPPAKKNKK